ncbi:diadenylate cyclase [Paenibacillus wenxiniae]|uniref:Diadenylate cyclase n=1 Tax=Paenibacillus wenxiniae TaxID=1636843 RepID=A0ABW4RHA1_9BACL
MKTYKHINHTIYNNLNEILNKLDNRVEVQACSIIFGENRETLNIAWIEESITNEEKYEVKIETQKTLTNALKKLGISNDKKIDESLFLAEEINNQLIFQSYIQEENTENIISSISSTAKSEKTHIPYETIMYVNDLNIAISSKSFHIRYILLLKNIDSVNNHLFNYKPQVAFLRMVLDYYFQDYYKINEHSNLVLLDNNGNIEMRYRENSSQFLQRMARLFFGKVENMISENKDMSFMMSSSQEITETEKSQYYINPLFDKIESISTRTYEGKHPFGCLLILTPSQLSNPGLINYLIHFEQTQTITLEDARRIRKLLELTNNEQDMYIIADHNIIYGIGDINWSMLEVEDEALFKVEFKGLSRYDLTLVSTEKLSSKDARIINEADAKIFQMTTKLGIVSKPLISLSFKYPQIGIEGFNAEQFERIMKNQFKSIGNDHTKKLRSMIQKATEQQNGTMIVITDPSTAKSELQKLSKQSTLIQSEEINPLFIKYLATIDGAIYFDTTGACHAIGVILDGLAEGDGGDASRGARFHSAHRYMAKLKKEHKACVIAIISEDGMVNLIPEPVNKLTVIREVKIMMEDISKKDELNDSDFQSYAEKLKQLSQYTTIEHNNYFDIAKALYQKESFKEAINYCNRAISCLEKFDATYHRKKASALLKYAYSVGNPKDNPDKKQEKLTYFNLLLEETELIINNLNQNKYISNDYNLRALALTGIGGLSNGNERDEYQEKALDDYNQALKINQSSTLYYNRAIQYLEMEKFTEAARDYGLSYMIDYKDESLKRMEQLFATEHSLFFDVIDMYIEKKDETLDKEETMLEFLNTHAKRLLAEHPKEEDRLKQYELFQSIFQNE